MLLGGANYVLHLEIYDAADNEVAAALIRQASVLALDDLVGFAPEAHVAFELGFRKQGGIEPVIEVVTVIGNFVGEIGDLGLEGRGFSCKICAPAGVVVSSVVLDQAFAHFPGEVQSAEA